MKLDELIDDDAHLSAPAPPLAERTEISSLAYDSRRVQPGALFFCVPGFQSDGHSFAAQAVSAGAAALVVEHPVDGPVPQVHVSSVRAAMGPLAARFYGDPTGALRVTGVTGTNGKTTTAHLVRGLMEAAGQPCGLLGTVGSVIAGEQRPAMRTTPEAIDLQACFREMLDGGEVACAMEVSSHALALGRTSGVRFAAAVFTNLTQDHLDFHRTMEDYFQAKRLLFAPVPAAAESASGGGAGPGWTGGEAAPRGTGSEAAPRGTGSEAAPRGTGAVGEPARGGFPPEVSVVNAADPYGRRLIGELRGQAVVTFGVDADADYSATDLRMDFRGTRFQLRTPEGVNDVFLPVPGRFNVANALGALAAVRALGAELDVLLGALEDGVEVPGRFQPVEEGQDFAVIVDYAHTPDSLENVLCAARELASQRQGRVLCVFGAGGDRDRGKRPLMGAAAARLADMCIVTSDNPRSEDPERIIAEVRAGAGEGKRVRTEADRRAAIELAVEQAHSGDVLVIAGKGHEQGQEFADGRKLPFDDAAVAREALGARAA